jgi:hypothetical protein
MGLKENVIVDHLSRPATAPQEHRGRQDWTVQARRWKNDRMKSVSKGGFISSRVRAFRSKGIPHRDEIGQAGSVEHRDHRQRVPHTSGNHSSLSPKGPSLSRWPLLKVSASCLSRWALFQWEAQVVVGVLAADIVQNELPVRTDAEVMDVPIHVDIRRRIDPVDRSIRC